jgi:hypothetical protein
MMPSGAMMPPSVKRHLSTLKRGHFYFGQTGHYHFGITEKCFLLKLFFVPKFLTIEMKYDNTIDLELVEVNFGKAERL